MFFLIFGLSGCLVAGYFVLHTKGLVRYGWGAVLGLSIAATASAGWATFLAP
jgi:hypothetical protein